MSTPGIILVDHNDHRELQADYDSLCLPLDWRIVVTQSESMGDKLREVWPQVIDLPWLGLLNDDIVPRTVRWDQQIVSSLNGWNFVSCNDGWHAPRKAAGALCYSGDLLRATGWMFPKDLYHLYHDDVWENLGRATGCWQLRMDVMVEHLHATRGGTLDETHNKGHDHWDKQHAAYLAWQHQEMVLCIENIRNLRKRYFLANGGASSTQILLCHANDLFSSGRYLEATEKYHELLGSSEELTPQSRAAVHIQIAKAYARSAGLNSLIITHLFKAIAESPRARFTWTHLAEAMAIVGDWPTCFAASVNSLRSQFTAKGLIDPEPFLQADPLQLLQISAKELGVSELTLEALRADNSFIHVNSHFS